MKKMFATLLSTAMVLSMTACAGEEAKTPEEIYTEAIAKTSALGATQADAEMDMTMDMGGMSLGFGMDMQLKIKGTGADTQMQVSANTEILGEAIDMNYYFKDGVLYLNAMGQTGKMSLPAEEALAQTGADTEMLTNNLEIMETFEMVENEDGTIAFHYTVKQDAMKDALAAAMEQNAENADLLAGSEIVFNSMTGTTVVSADGYVLSDSLSADFSMSVEGQEVGAKMEIVMTYVDPGKDFTIDFPADLDTYPDLDLTTAA